MKIVLQSLLVSWCCVAGLAAQSEQTPPPAPTPANAVPETSLATPGKAALDGARKLYDGVRGLRGAERIAALEAAAIAFDRAVEAAATDAKLAATAAFFAAGAWRQHGSLALAEKAYLLAAQFDAVRYGPRALLGAADMQRRTKRNDEAMASYLKVTELDPASGSAQDARLWHARMLQAVGKIDAAIEVFQAALEAARAGRDTIDTANFLALAWIAKGDLESAGFALEHAEEAVAAMGEEDPVVVERLRKAVETMSARRALQRALDKRNGATDDAVRLDRAKRAAGEAEGG